ncbi:M48 family metalloprotease [Xanthobacter autotrophicus]|jgi:predicted Zn-dependent protease|uniref:Zn-dependent protease n=1 Tax=Xanthobacter autotrophicus TaxID=280 RepID=A0A6C1KBK0_XANAU|nr:M48 family metalloprotease [Xanthobacter autotrophicus]TLX40897.1 Zn-dependent protease [Xanthobacter autotrophicus]
MFRLSRLARALPLLFPLWLAACAGLDLDQASVPLTSAAPASEYADMSPNQRREHERLVASYGGAYNDPELKALIQQVVERLVAASERPDLKYRVTVLNSPAINAFALPDGSLYVTRGLLSLANDTSELSSVLAHEMAHVIARHATIREDQVKQAVLVSRVISDVVNDPDLGALAMQKSRRTLASFSRGQELEADAIGVGIAARAGFDPYGASRFLTDMGRFGDLKSAAFSGSSSTTPDMDFLSSHPATPERISIAIANARQYANGAPQGDGERDRNAYFSAIDGMVYGDDPKEGFVRGRKFFHPKLGFTFTAPEGFSLENTSQAVLGATQSGREALRLDAVRVAPDQSLAQYLSSGWVEGVEINTVETLTVNGFTASTAIARGDQWSFRMFAIRFGSDVYRLIFAARELTPELDKQFRAAADTFRRVSSGEAETVKPLRVRIVTAGLGDNVEKMAARMQVPDRPTERFLILNGLDASAKLKYGEKVKIIAE